MIGRIFFGILLCGYLAVILPFSASLTNRPIVVKLGTLPEAEPLKMMAGDHRYLVAQYVVAKVLFYYGSLVEHHSNKLVLEPEYPNMFKMMQTSSKLDPWNADVYYFTQASFTWEVNKIREVNEMLDYGMRYRTWDYQLPFFAGFNSAYFLKDFTSAASYFKKAAELSGQPLMANLTARYMYESGQTQMALGFIEFMQKHTTDTKMIQLYEFRKKALVAVLTIERTVGEYRRRFGTAPPKISDLVASGLLAQVPDDPYGGSFFLDEKGVVRSTSKLAFGGRQPGQKMHQRETQ
ncbi:MAG TPA: hypothetical protein DCZ75_05685 [Geobacter sp.]|nr:hypothetical protein [Geobacter sp.]